jgi:aspartyl-tRNA(Asn)/glutamyl-tRNA(Gln) amidotransferase subunit C
MEITREQAQYIAKLAKLSFNGEELDKIAVDMQSILEFAREINALDTSNVPAMEHVLPMQNVLREDSEPVPFPREALLQNAPEQMDGCFAVPKVIE